jgi:hypothetical protein
MPHVSHPSSGSETPPICNPYSEGGEARRDALFDLIDTLPLWQVELIWDYGVDRTLRMVREHPTPARARKALEAERQRNEALRWAHGGTLPSGY